MKFKIKDAIEVRNADQGQFHARTLRAIGQDLSELFPQCLEITLHGMDFHVVGRYLPRSPRSNSSQQSGRIINKLRSKLLGGSSDPAAAGSVTDSASFNRTYTPADIERLDEVGMNRRNNEEKGPDVYGLGEILRMVGRLVDADGSRLRKLSRNTYGVVFEYEDGNGQIQKKELSSLELYKLQQQYYGERGTFVPIDKWDGSL